MALKAGEETWSCWAFIDYVQQRFLSGLAVATSSRINESGCSSTIVGNRTPYDLSKWATKVLWGAHKIAFLRCEGASQVFRGNIKDRELGMAHANTQVRQ